MDLLSRKWHIHAQKLSQYVAKIIINWEFVLEKNWDSFCVCRQGLPGLRGEAGPPGPVGPPGNPGTPVSIYTVWMLLHYRWLNITAVILQGKAGDDGKPGAPGKMVTCNDDSLCLYKYSYKNYIHYITTSSNQFDTKYSWHFPYFPSLSASHLRQYGCYFL